MSQSWVGIANTSKIIGINIAHTHGILICTHTFMQPLKDLFILQFTMKKETFYELFFLRDVKIVIHSNEFPYALNAPSESIFPSHMHSLCLSDHLPAPWENFFLRLLCPLGVMTLSGASGTIWQNSGPYHQPNIAVVYGAQPAVGSISSPSGRCQWI